MPRRRSHSNQKVKIAVPLGEPYMLWEVPAHPKDCGRDQPSQTPDKRLIGKWPTTPVRLP
jgi:hypothetical protein